MTSPVVRHSGALALAFAAAVAGYAGVAGAQEHGGRRFTRTPSHGPIGTVIQVKGEGCAENGRPYDTAHIYLYDGRGSEYGFYRGDKVPINSDGTFDGTVTVPAEATPGRHLVAATCQEGDRLKYTPDVAFTVDGPAATRSPRPTRTRTSTPTAPPTVTRAPTRTPAATPKRTPTPALTRPTPSRTRRALRPPTTRPAASIDPVPAAAPGPPIDGAQAAAGALAAAFIAANAAALLRLRRPDSH